MFLKEGYVLKPFAPSTSSGQTKVRVTRTLKALAIKDFVRLSRVQPL
jgi:hypothetical protein